MAGKLEETIYQMVECSRSINAERGLKEASIFDLHTIRNYLEELSGWVNYLKVVVDPTVQAFDDAVACRDKATDDSSNSTDGDDTSAFAKDILSDNVTTFLNSEILP